MIASALSFLPPQIPSGMPSVKLIKVADMMSASVTKVWSVKPMLSINQSEAAQNNANFQPRRQYPMPMNMAANNQNGIARRPFSIPAVDLSIAVPMLSNKP